MINVYVGCHIDVPIPRMPYFSPIQTGAVFKTPWNDFLRDDIGDNISAKNRHFAELTALYWIWKNTSDEKVGWCHYRRYFSPVLFTQNLQKGAAVDLPIAQIILDQDKNGGLFDFELKFAQMIVPTLIPMGLSPTKWYCMSHRESDWQAMLRGIADLYPDEHAEAVKYFDTEGNQHFWCMFIANRQTLNEYCQWLFPLLFHLETQITPPEDNTICRVYAQLSEHLFNWWRVSRNIQIITRPIIYIENPAVLEARNAFIQEGRL